jgi:hypothetical protein
LPTPSALDCCEPKETLLQQLPEREFSGREEASFLRNVQSQNNLGHQMKLEASVAEDVSAPTAQGTCGAGEFYSKPCQRVT